MNKLDLGRKSVRLNAFSDAERVCLATEQGT